MSAACAEIGYREGENRRRYREKRRAFGMKKEASPLVGALQILIAQDLDGATAEKLLDRIDLCLEKQGKRKTKGAL